MTLADVLAVLAGLAIAGAGFASVSLILSLLAPRSIERGSQAVAGRPGRCLAVGLLATLVVLVAAGGLLKVPSPLARLAGLGSILLGLSFCVLGGAGVAATLARRLRGSAGGVPGVREMLRGVFVLESAVLLPIVGWFVVLPAAFFVSFGAGLLAALARESAAGAAVAAAQG